MLLLITSSSVAAIVKPVRLLGTDPHGMDHARAGTTLDAVLVKGL